MRSARNNHRAITYPTGMFMLCLLSSASAQYAHMNDAQYEPFRSFIAPLDQHRFPRITLTETKVPPTSAEAVSKYDSIQLDGFMMTPTVELAQRINPNLLVFRKFNAAGYRHAITHNFCWRRAAPAARARNRRRVVSRSTSFADPESRRLCG